MLNLEMCIDDAIFRIKREYKRCEGKIYLSFSGGKDSTVLAELIKMADLPTEIPFVFANTGIELDATLRFVREYNYSNVVIVRPKKSFDKILKEYGKPVLSKIKSEHLATHQRNIDDPLRTVRQRHLILGEMIRNGEPQGVKTRVALGIKDFHFLHKDLEYKISNKCCDYLKKRPFADYVKENDMRGTFTGVRVAEGGARGMKYKSCVEVKVDKGKEYVTSMPIFDWSDEIVEEFIEKYDVKLSDCYEKFGMTRTGCFLCPFGKNIKADLKVLYDHEPQKYKASLHWLKDVFMDQGVELDWDETYMNDFKIRERVVKRRRQEMIDNFSPKFNPKIRKVW